MTADCRCGRKMRRFTSQSKYGTLHICVCAGCGRQWSPKGKELTPGRRKRLARMHDKRDLQELHARRQLAAAARRINERGRRDDGSALQRHSRYPVVPHRKR